MFLNNAITSVLQCVQPKRTYHRNKNGLFPIELLLTTPGMDTGVIWCIYMVAMASFKQKCNLARSDNTRVCIIFKQLERTSTLCSLPAPGTHTRSIHVSSKLLLYYCFLNMQQTETYQSRHRQVMCSSEAENACLNHPMTRYLRRYRLKTTCFCIHGYLTNTLMCRKPSPIHTVFHSENFAYNRLEKSCLLLLFSQETTHSWRVRILRPIPVRLSNQICSEGPAISIIKVI